MAAEALPRRAQATFVGSLEQLARVRAFIAHRAPLLGCGDQDTFALELACDEAATNIINHAFPERNGELRVELWREAEAVIVTLSYHGQAFDPLQIPEPVLDVPLEQRPIGGLGLYFMRQMMNEVHFEFDAVQGNRLTMRRVLKAES